MKAKNTNQFKLNRKLNQSVFEMNEEQLYKTFLECNVENKKIDISSVNQNTVSYWLL